MTLPIYDIREKLIRFLEETPRLIIEAPTGSGKSTQVPQMLLDSGLAGDGEVVVLQPRRLATRLLARRVAEERGSAVGEEVGYQVRFEHKVSARTRIRYVTEGVLLRQLLSDPELKGVAAVVFDEFHERHLYGDITLARIADLQKNARPDLKIVVMSATLEADKLVDYLAPCGRVVSEGRTFPVEIRYLHRQSATHQERVWDLAATVFEQAIKEVIAGDFLIFMPGAYEIAQTVNAIRNSSYSKGFAVLPLHGELAPHLQDQAVSPSVQRKVVVATNVAETSITIDGVQIVIDGGLARIARYDASRRIDTLLVEKISKASADQRAGRAGRTAAGTCFRLWTQSDHSARPNQEKPEVHRTDLAEVSLALKACGIIDLNDFNWVEAPEPVALERAETLLRDLSAVDRNGAITDIGRRMLAFPVHPRYARLLLAADEFYCVRQACLIAALTQGRSILTRNVDRRVKEARDEQLGDSEGSDFSLLMQAWNFASSVNYNLAQCQKLGIHAGAARQVAPLYERFLNIARKEGLPINDCPPQDEQLRKCILAAFSDNLARRLDRGTLRCDLIHGRRADLARDSVVRSADLFVAAEITEIQGGRQVNTLINLATAVEEEWLKEIWPEDFGATETVCYDRSVNRVVCSVDQKFRDLVLVTRVKQEVSPDAAAEILAGEVIAGNLELKNWDAEVEKWITKVNCMASWCPELQLNPIDEDARRMMIEQICYGSFGRRDLKECKVWPVVNDWLMHVQREMIQKQLPDQLMLSNGTRARVRYQNDGPPIVSATIQRLYGVDKVPCVAFGKVPVAVEVLAPNQRPQQLTQDMKSFWENAYPLLKKELKGRYPKHEWR
jgi:ATP-dependent helicase HrpB